MGNRAETYSPSFDEEQGEAVDPWGVNQQTRRVFEAAKRASLQADEVADEYLRNVQDNRLTEIQ